MKRNKGITLIALVITIIVLIILAGISIAQINGNGLLEKAKVAEEKEKNAQNIENAYLKDYEDKIEEYISQGSRNDTEMDILEILKYLAGNIESENYDNLVDDIVNSKEKMNEICSSKNIFTICANSKKMLKKMYESKISRNAMYDNAEITEPILANSNMALEMMKESEQYEVVSASLRREFDTLYDGKAFVLGVSQTWHNGMTPVTMTYGKFIVGDLLYTYSAGGKGQTNTGLGIIVNKFASCVQQKNSYGDNSNKMSFSAIFKID